MKPRIADLESNGVLYVDVWESLPALLRLARAAKAYSDMTLMANDETDEDTKHHLEDRAEYDWDEMQAALDAFDWDDDVEVDDGTRKKSKA